MPKKTTLKGQFLRTSLAMLVLSLLIGVAVMVAVMIFFTVRVPDGEKFLMESLSFLFGKQTIGPSRMVPVLVLAGVLLCLMVTGVCILLTSRLTGRITATLKTLRQGKRYLLMGLRLNRDTERMVMADIIYAAHTSPGWVLIAEPTAKEERFCARLGLEIIRADIGELIGETAMAA